MRVANLEVCLRPRTHDVIRIPGVLEVTLVPACYRASLVSRRESRLWHPGSSYPVYCLIDDPLSSISKHV